MSNRNQILMKDSALKDKIIEKFKALIKEGQDRVSTDICVENRPHIYKEHLPHKEYNCFRIEALNLIRAACGENSVHYQGLVRLSKFAEFATNCRYWDRCLGIVEAAMHDFEGGYLFNLHSILSAEIHSDLLDQAEYLNSEGYYIPSASLAGAILENILRELCDANSLAYPEKTQINPLNDLLYKANVYNLYEHKQIIAYADIRNNADHGHFDKFKSENVNDMIKYIRRFASEYLK